MKFTAPAARSLQPLSHHTEALSTPANATQSASRCGNDRGNRQCAKAEVAAPRIRFRLTHDDRLLSFTVDVLQRGKACIAMENQGLPLRSGGHRN
jgi:hypothetical protein